ncbi:hypothetical protein FXO37_33687 [Capsicum annuum]|nr:hypothetical protein FXO37_33687 [Capsicum annuum]
MHVFVKGNILRFSIYEFVLITNLKCYENVGGFRYEDSSQSRLLRRYFPQSMNGIDKEALIEHFFKGKVVKQSPKEGEHSDDVADVEGHNNPISPHFDSKNQSRSKEKKKLISTEQKKYPFEGYDITGDSPNEVMEVFEDWNKEDLYKQHMNKKKYKNKNFPTNRYTINNCFFQVYIDKEYVNYSNADVGKELTTQDVFTRTNEVSQMGMSLINTIKGLGTPAGQHWHQVNKVFVPINCGSAFHWVLAVIALRDRCIRVYDSRYQSWVSLWSFEINMPPKGLTKEELEISQHLCSWSKPEEDPHEFLDMGQKVTDIIGVTSSESAELATYQLQDYSHLEVGGNEHGFFNGFSYTSRQDDSIWVIVDRMNKSAYFMPVHSSYSAKDYAKIYVRDLVRLHGVSLSIIFDRGSEEVWQEGEAQSPIYRSLLNPHPFLRGSQNEEQRSSIVKVLWRNQSIERATWEAKPNMRTKYPHLFSANLDSAQGSDNRALDRT